MDKEDKTLEYNLRRIRNEFAHSMDEKWGNDVSVKGFSQIPYYLLNINRYLPNKLSSLQILILIHLVSHWWEKEKNPFPSMKYLALKCGVSERQIQRCINDLIARDFIGKEKISLKNKFKKNEPYKKNNSYDMNKLVKVLKNINEIEKRLTEEKKLDDEAISD